MAGQTAELGTAYISVVADTGDLAKGIKEALAQSEKNAPKSGNAIGQGLTAGINKTLKAGVIGVGVAAGGVLAGALSKGFSRRNALDQAESKLKGLGFSADEVARSLEGVNKSVKGTAFGLDEAAGSAAKLTGVGVAVGKELDRSLTLTADIAAQAGTSMDDISSVMAKIAGSGKLTGETLAQLEDRATGASGALADHLGVSIEEARKQVSEGAIDFETFQAAMEGHIGGAAQKTGETFQGAFDNMGAAMGRLGDKLIAPVFDNAPAVFGAIGGAFDTLGEKLEPLIEDFAEWLAPRMEDFAENTVPKLVDGVMSAVDSFIEFGGWVKNNAEWIKPLAVGIGGAVAAIYAWNTATTIAKGVQAAFNAIVAANPIMLIVVAVAAVTAALVYFFTQTEVGQRIWETLVESFRRGIEWITTAFDGLKNLVVGGDFTTALRDAFGWEEDHPMVRGILAVRDAISNVIDLAKGVYDVLFKGDYTGLPFGLEEDSGFVNFLFGLRDAAIAVGNVIKSVFTAIGKIAAVTLGVIGTAILAPLILAWDGLSAAIKAGWEGLVKPAWEAMHELASNVAGWVAEKFGWLSAQIDSAIAAIDGKIQQFQQAVSDLWDKYVSPVLTSISDKWNELKDRISAAYETIKSAVIDAFGAALQDLWNAIVAPILENISAKWNWLKDILFAGWQFVQGSVFEPFKTGLTALQSFFESVVNAIGGVWDSLRAKLAKPINFMITDVYNNGILKAWNIMSEFLPGLEPGKAAQPIPGYAAGGRVQENPTGRVSGPGTGTSDSILARIANGEHILTAAEVAKAGGHGVIYAMRDLIAHGRAFSFDGKGGLVGLGKQLSNKAGDLAGAAPGLFLPRFAKGGEVRPLWETQLEAAHKFAQAQHGKPYQWAGPNGPGSSFDCSGFMGSIAATIQGTNPWQRYWATMSFANGRTAQGFVPGLGPGFSIGLFNGGPYGGHTAGTLGAAGKYGPVNVESGGSPSQVKYGIGAVGADHNSFTHRYHLPIGADGAFVSGGAGGFDFLGAVKKWVSDKLTSILDPIKDKLPAGPPAWQDIPKGFYSASTESLRKRTDEKLADLGHLASGVWAKITDLFDNGGWLMPGRMATNKTGKPEPILTAAQWSLVGRMLQEWPRFTESMSVVAEEISAAFRGGDWGYGELASYVGEDAAVKILDAASLMGGYVDTFAGATEELGRAFHGGDWGYGALAELLGDDNAAMRLANAASDMGGYVYTLMGAVDEMTETFHGRGRGYDALAELVGDEIALKMTGVVSLMGGYVYTFGGAVDEISEAFRGGDWGHGSLAELIGNDDIAKRIVDAATFMGEVTGLAGGFKLAEDAAKAMSAVLSGTFFDATEEVQKALSDLEAAREKAADGSDKIRQADENLVKAQKELQDALSGTADTSVSSSRKLEDAQEALRKAQADADAVAAKEFKGEDAAKKRADAQAKAAEKVAAAEERLERAREDASTQAERDAEKQADRVDKARQNLEKAEKGVVDARKQSVENADEVVAAEKRLAQVRANVTIGAVNDVIGGLQTVAGAVSRFAGRMRELAADAAATEEQLRGMRVENAALNIQRLQALLKLRQAENDLGAARLAAGRAGAESMKYLGDTSVAAIGDALVRFRETGVFSVEMVSGAAVDGANAVGEAHSAAANTAAEGNLQMQLAAIEFAKASLAATHAVEMQSLVAEKLKEQTEQLYGLTEEQWGSVEKSTSGAGGFLGGFSKVLEAVMRGFVGYGKGGWVGALLDVLPVLGDAIGGLFDMFNGFGDVIDNIGDAFHAFLNMGLEGQIDTALQFFTGLIPNILGWIAAALTGDASHIKTGREQAQNATDSANKHIDEKINRRKQEIEDKYDQAIKDLQIRQDSEMAALTLKGQLLQLEFDFGEMWSAPEVQEIVSSIKASNEQQGTLVGHNVEAVGYQKQIAADVNAIAVKPDKKIEITLVGDATSNDRVESMLGQLGDQLGGVDVRVRRLESASTQQVVDSRR